MENIYFHYRHAWEYFRSIQKPDSRICLLYEILFSIWHESGLNSSPIKFTHGDIMSRGGIMSSGKYASSMKWLVEKALICDYVPGSYSGKTGNSSLIMNIMAFAPPFNSLNIEKKTATTIQNNRNGGDNHIIIGAEKQEIAGLKKQNEQLQKELHAAKDKIISLLEKNM